MQIDGRGIIWSRNISWHMDQKEFWENGIIHTFGIKCYAFNYACRPSKWDAHQFNLVVVEYSKCCRTRVRCIWCINFFWMWPVLLVPSIVTECIPPEELKIRFLSSGRGATESWPSDLWRRKSSSPMATLSKPKLKLIHFVHFTGFDPLFIASTLVESRDTSHSLYCRKTTWKRKLFHDSYFCLHSTNLASKLWKNRVYDSNQPGTSSANRT